MTSSFFCLSIASLKDLPIEYIACYKHTHLFMETGQFKFRFLRKNFFKTEAIHLVHINSEEEFYLVHIVFYNCFNYLPTFKQSEILSNI